MVALRAYLLTSQSPGDWDVTVHRDLETLNSEWNSLLGQNSNSSGVVHLGFGSIHPTNLEGLFAQHPGRVLVSEAAKWALPPGFKTSSRAIGHLELAEADFALPVYLGIEGWGYSVQDDELPEEQDIPESPASVNVQLLDVVGWLARLQEDEPAGVFQELISRKVTNDDEYLGARREMPEKLRDELDLARFNYLSRTLEPDDFEGLIYALPLFVLRRKIDDMGLSVRIKHVFGTNHIKVVEDLEKFRPIDLLGLTNFGRTSLRDLMVGLRLAVDEGPQTSPVLEEKANDRSLLENYRASTSALPANAREILAGRLGENGPRQTLEEVGTRLNVTRERIRQLEAKHISRIIEKYYWDDVIGLKLSALRENRTEPIYLELLEVEDPWFIGFEDNLEHLKWIIEYFTKDNPKSYFVIEAGGRRVVTTISEDSWGRMSKSFRDAILNGDYEGSPETEVLRLAESIAGSYGAPELGSLLLRQHSQIIYLSEPSNGGERTVTAVGSKVSTAIFSVLNEADRPLYYSEIARRVMEDHGVKTTERAVHGALPRSGGVLYSRGTYGLPHHLPIPEDLRESVRDFLEQVVITWPDERQWHSGELADLVAEDFPELGNDVNQYVIDRILERSGSLQYLGRHVWAYAPDQELTTGDRTNIATICEEILRDIGHPLSTVALIEEVKKRRGVGNLAQIHPRGGLVRTEDGNWALIDWEDDPIS